MRWSILQCAVTSPFKVGSALPSNMIGPWLFLIGAILTLSQRSNESRKSPHLDDSVAPKFVVSKPRNSASSVPSEHIQVHSYLWPSFLAACTGASVSYYAHKVVQEYFNPVLPYNTPLYLRFEYGSALFIGWISLIMGKCNLSANIVQYRQWGYPWTAI